MLSRGLLWRGVVLAAVVLVVASPSAQRGQARQAPQAAGGLRPQQGSLRVGDLAPEFSLASPDGKTTATLSSFRGKSPVGLVFGSFT